MNKRILFLVAGILAIALLAQNSSPRWIHLLKDGNTVAKYRVIEDFDSVVVYKPSEIGLVGNDKTLYVMKDGDIVNQYKLHTEIDNLAVLGEGEFVDTRDGNVYKTVQIGRQVWMAENLKYLPEVSGPESGSNYKPRYYVYDYDGTDIDEAKAAENYQTYGVLYNWAAAMDGSAASNRNPSWVKGICPKGWHLPSSAEWNELQDYLIANGYNYDGTTTGNKIAIAMAEEGLWSSFPITGAIGGAANYPEFHNKSGFSALPGGQQKGLTTGFDAVKTSGFWQSSTEVSGNRVSQRNLRYRSRDLMQNNSSKDYAGSIRCVRDYTSRKVTLLVDNEAMGDLRGGGSCAVGEVVTIQAVAKSCFQFVNWTGDVEYLEDVNAAETQLVMPDKDLVIKANFEEHPCYTLTVQPLSEEMGSVKGEGVYSSGEKVTIQSAANVGYVFVNWSGDIEYLEDPNAKTTQLTMPAKELSLVANFVRDVYFDNVGSFIDTRDNMKYSTVQIGRQVWMAENLKYLPVVIDPETGSISEPCYYVYDYIGTDVDEAKSTENYQTYGVLYNWIAAMGDSESSNRNPSWVQGICPEGWHLPSDAEWSELQDYLIANGYNYDGTTVDNKIAIAMVQLGLWNSYSEAGTVGNGLNYPEYVNKSGFSALPGGVCANGLFSGIAIGGYWWSSTESYANNAINRLLGYLNNSVDRRDYNEKEVGFSVRCVKDYPVFQLELLSVNEEMGSVKGLGVYAAREVFEIAAIANYGYKFAYWSGDIEFLEDPHSAVTKVTMPAKGITVTANFEKEDFFDNIGSLIDSRDNSKYNTIKIGDQVWMAENLKYLPEITNPNNSSKIEPCYYIYGYYGSDLQEAKKTDNYQSSGVLYNWAAAMGGSGSSSSNPSGVQGICPEGWHLPSQMELSALAKIYNHEIGFSAFPVGSYFSTGGIHFGGSSYVVNSWVCWWSSTESNEEEAVNFAIDYHYSIPYTGLVEQEHVKGNGYSVRCVQD